MSARLRHLQGDCWWGCPYCAAEDEQDAAVSADGYPDDQHDPDPTTT